MKRLLLLLLYISGAVTLTHAQHSIQSVVVDAQNGQAIELATIRLTLINDSSFIQGTRTNSNGEFMLSRVLPGNYKLIVSILGYKEHVQTVKMEAHNLLLKHIQLTQNITKLDVVEVKGTAAQLVVKGDTTEYNATAFKTAQNSVVEDLLKKMPGVEVSADGKITVNGQDIKKVRVDGKKFFDGDIEMATKNIPADMIDKVQIYENKSDMAKLTGFEDNDTERIINLTTKANRKHGIFGNVSGAAGSDIGNDKNDFRYDSNSFLNLMNQELQTAITAGANNTNTARSGRSRSAMGNSGGITATQNLGINNNTILSPKLTIGGDASFNHSANLTDTKNKKYSYLKGANYTNLSNNRNETENSAYNLRLESEWKPDTLNTLLIQPNINYNQSHSQKASDFTYLTETDTTSIGYSANHGNGTSLSAGLNLIYNRKFVSKPGRNITINLQQTVAQNQNENWNVSARTALRQTSRIDQYIHTQSNSYKQRLRISYVEPLWNKYNLMEATIAGRMTRNYSEKNQYEKDPDGDFHLTEGVYARNDTLSNTFSNHLYNETVELNYRYTKPNFNLTIGANASPSQTSYSRLYSNGLNRDTTYGVINYSPQLRFQYNFDKKKYVRLDYKGDTDQPDINQMQPVINNSNLMNEVVGNPNLNPEYTHSLRLFYSSYNSTRFSSFNVMLNGQITKDALVTNSIFDATGKQYSQTINATEKPYSISSYLMYNTPLIQKRLQFNTRTAFSTNQKIGYSKSGRTDIDIYHLLLGDLSQTQQYSASQGLSLTFTTDILELGSSGNFRYSNTDNNLQPMPKTTYNWFCSGYFVAHLPYTLNISSDLNYATMQGYAGFDKNQLIWNASVDKSFFNNKGVVAVKVFDILHRRLNVNQTIGDNYIQYSYFNTLTSYFLVSFAYKINDFKGAYRNNSPGENRGNRKDYNYEPTRHDKERGNFSRPGHSF